MRHADNANASMQALRLDSGDAARAGLKAGHIDTPKSSIINIMGNFHAQPKHNIDQTELRRTYALRRTRLSEMAYSCPNR